jgi:hypothetical protein
MIGEDNSGRRPFFGLPVLEDDRVRGLELRVGQ